jgi:hypothetical protein
MSVKEDFQLPQLAQFVDAHLLLPLLDFAEHRQVMTLYLYLSPLMRSTRRAHTTPMNGEKSDFFDQIFVDSACFVSCSCRRTLRVRRVATCFRARISSTICSTPRPPAPPPTRSKRSERRLRRRGLRCRPNVRRCSLCSTMRRSLRN